MSMRVEDYPPTPPHAPQMTIALTPERCFLNLEPNAELPRAWQRKPSTAFAPRTEKQKISKRYILRNHGTKDESVVKDDPRTGAEASRALKRLRPNSKTDKVTGNRSMEYVGTRWTADAPGTRRKGPRLPELESSGAGARRGLKHRDRVREVRLNPQITTTPLNLDTTEADVMTMPGASAVGEQEDAEDSNIPKAIGNPYHAPRPQAKQDPASSENDNQRSEVAGIKEPLVAPASGPGNLRPDLDRRVAAERFLEKHFEEGLVTQKASSLPSTDLLVTTGLSGPSVEMDTRTDQENTQLTRTLSMAPEQAVSNVSSLVDEIEQDLTSGRGHEALDGQARGQAGALTTEQYRQDQSPEKIDELPYRPEDDPTKPQLRELVSTRTAAQDDDTEYLHGFISRAKARKAEASRATRSPVKQVALQRSTTPSPPPLPLSESRKVLQQVNSNTTPPTEVRDLHSKWLSTLENAPAPDANTGSPSRRSNRKSLPRPHRNPIAAPSSIPVRRSEGNGCVVLQRSQAQQVALATRNNTKMNKGEAVMPKTKLQALSQQQCSPTKSPRKRGISNKEVSWDKQLASFGSERGQEGLEEQVEVEQERLLTTAKVRKTRRLGTSNGTPTAKKAKPQSDMNQTTPKLRKKAGRKA